MSDSRIHEGCPHHYMVVEGVNYAKETADEAKTVAMSACDIVKALTQASNEFKAETQRGIESLATSIADFKKETNLEIYGEKGPSGADGIKPIAHRNRDRLAEIERTKTETSRDWVTLLVHTAAPFLAAGLLYLMIGKG